MAHAKAKLTPAGRLLLVQRILVEARSTSPVDNPRHMRVEPAVPLRLGPRNFGDNSGRS